MLSSAAEGLGPGPTYFDPAKRTHFGSGCLFLQNVGKSLTFWQADFLFGIPTGQPTKRNQPARKFRFLY